jgi:predicted O-linked N-acetylglucosamine transferase (SPINDLY family)
MTQDVRALLEQALALHRQGRLPEAETLCRRILAAAPHLIQAGHLLGVTLARQGRLPEALAAINQALTQSPDAITLLATRAGMLHSLKRWDEALADFDRVLAAQPSHAETWFGRGGTLRRLNRAADALESYARALALAPNDSRIFNNRANLLRDLGRHEEALADYDRSLALQPRQANALINRGHLLMANLDRPEDAAASYAAALAIDSSLTEAKTGFVAAQNHLAASFLQENRATDALAAADAALARDGRNADALNYRGGALTMLKRFDQAMASIDAALTVDPAHEPALNNRGLIYLAVNHFEEALAAFGTLLAAHPQSPVGLSNRAIVLGDMGRHAEAARDLEMLLAADPSHRSAFGALAGAVQHLCDWRRREEIATALPGRIRNQGSLIPAVTLLGYSDDPALLHENAQKMMRKVVGTAPPAKAPAPVLHERIRIAYLSADFRPHPVAYQIADLIERHDRAKFEIIGIALGTDAGSPIRARLERAFDTFRDVTEMDDTAVAGLLRRMEIDIAVDLHGYTAGGRPGILALRPAPVQVNYLGYPGTMGAGFMDYVIADPQIAPFAHQPWFSEQIVQLPFSYMPADSARPVVAPTSRAAAGLPEQGLVFCCFNSNWKITPSLFDVWMKLLLRVPQSVLWLRQDNDGTRRALMAEAQARGIDPARLVFAPRVDTVEEHAARQACADLFLDTLPYNAHATACDALWAGVPVITCRGGAFAGRVGAGLLDAVGLPELITDDLKAYEDLALALAQDAERLQTHKEKLAANRARAPLFDTDRYRRHIEAAFTTMMDIARKGEAPRPFAVLPD